MNPVVWQPTSAQAESSEMHAFMRAAGFSSYPALHEWSIAQRADFWTTLAKFCNVRFSDEADAVLQEHGEMLNARWFPGATVNYAEHLLRHSGDRAALVFRGEQDERQELSFDTLRAEVAAVAAGLRKKGVVAGDRVAGYLPNCPEAIIAMLAATSIGAIWSSCSPDFGVNGVVDRFGQIEPKVLFCVDGYRYNGKTFDLTKNVADVLQRVPSIAVCVVIGFAGNQTLLRTSGYSSWEEIRSRSGPLTFTPVPFDHPLFIMYSSGTTGAPKCIVHGHGGTLLQHLKEHVLHCDLGESDRLFYFTTCGWMMWNWLASGLATGATLVLFDGAPFANDGRVLWQIAAEEKVTVFGTSAKYISAQEKAGIRPVDEYDLSSLRSVLSTGSPLAPASFDYVYAAISANVQLASIAGGTDIISCFVLGNPLLPVRRGEIQCLGLGMDVDIFDDNGKPLRGQAGELVCKQSFPSMPVGFWNDDNNERYRSAYFERYPGIWAHGDYAEIAESGGIVIEGRSDAVLNPGGVRIGTAEIYRQVEKLDEVIESIAIGQQWDDDVRVVLFVVLRDGVALDDTLRQKIGKQIRDNTTPRHVPAKIIAVPAIPRTISGKIVELAVRSIVHGKPVRNTDALANPEALDHFRELRELQD